MFKETPIATDVKEVFKALTSVCNHMYIQPMGENTVAANSNSECQQPESLKKHWLRHT